jgi:hypothetical protein
VARVMRVAALRLGHRDDVAHVLNHDVACGHVAQGEDALAVHAGGLDFDARMIQRQRDGLARE